MMELELRNRKAQLLEQHMEQEQVRNRSPRQVLRNRSFHRLMKGEP